MVPLYPVSSPSEKFGLGRAADVWPTDLVTKLFDVGGSIQHDVEILPFPY
jgi:hypothetical protein